MHEADSLYGLGRVDALLDVARRWTTRAPSGPGFRALAAAEVTAGRPEEAVAAARRALELDGTGLSRTTLAEALVLTGRYREAEALVRPVLARGSTMERAEATGDLAVALAYQGRRREALRVVDEMPEYLEEKKGHREALRFELLLGDAPSEDVLRQARALAASPDRKSDPHEAIPFLVAGDVEDAERLARKLPAPARRQYDAVLAWKQGDPGKALEILREVAKSPEPMLRGPTLFLLARVASEVGRDDEVVRAVEGLRKTPSGPWRSWGWPKALLLAARAHEHRGELARARAAVDEVLAMWKGADPDLPMLAEARGMRGRLAMR
jgi:tetratricopeptide (TPR) repeat protein